MSSTMNDTTSTAPARPPVRDQGSCAHERAIYASHSDPERIADLGITFSGWFWTQTSWPCPDCGQHCVRLVTDNRRTDDGDWTASAWRGPWVTQPAGPPLAVGRVDPAPDPARVATPAGHLLDLLALRVRDAVASTGIHVLVAPSCQSTAAPDLGVAATPPIIGQPGMPGLVLAYRFDEPPGVVVDWAFADELDLSTVSYRSLLAGLRYALQKGPARFECEPQLADGSFVVVEVNG